MGSAKERKQNDQPLIRRPSRAVALAGSESGGGAPADGDSLPDLCPFKFQVSVIKSNLVYNGVRLELLPQRELYSYNILGHELGVLSKKLSTTITNCGRLGIKYSGEIVEVNEEFYARFTRVA